ncbi:hypothetical protein V5P93_005653 [Actinokineospora auranticolor]|uniref:DUF6777 domain-containing protein n=1 Tax=Actinokineospora auranticolor TaxID=155976 RepID=A0A2S6GEX9_9PSEU|nr:DUF6777 domain-containing protein [Actinokineospora auranticolor]PPK63784.1 hypothetical protein CLV40_12424 [Actinokineospora auranticolor]
MTGDAKTVSSAEPALVAIAFFLLPTMVDDSGDTHSGAWVASSGGWLTLLWLVPVAAIAMCVLRTRTVVVGSIAAACALGYIAGLEGITHPSGTLTLLDEGIPPSAGIGWGLPLIVGCLVVTLARCALRFGSPYRSGTLAGVALGTAVSLVLLVVTYEDGRGRAILLPSEPGLPSFQRGTSIPGDTQSLYLVPAKCDLTQPTMTPVALRTDTRVTAASSYQAVLQAGTPVLVDRRGIPRFRCSDGLSLEPPRGETKGYVTTPWADLTAVEVTPAEQDIAAFLLMGNGNLVRRTAGTSDSFPLVRGTAIPQGNYRTVGAISTCIAANCAKSQIAIFTLATTGCPNTCRIQVIDWTEGSRLRKTGDTWSSTDPLIRPPVCNGTPMTATLTTTVNVNTGTLVANTWAANDVEGDITLDARGANCDDMKVTWHYTGNLKP